MSAQLFALSLAAVVACAGVAASEAPPTHRSADTTHHASVVSDDLDSLIRSGLQANPSIRAAEHRQDAARARVGPAGSWADPVLGVGLTDLPIARPGFYDSFTMKVVRVTQTLPLAGAPVARGRMAEREAAAAGYRVEAMRLETMQQIKDAYYDLVFLDRALAIVQRSHDVLVDLGKVSEARYAAGTGSQQDVLKARLEAARLADQAVTLREQRLAALAQLNAALDRPSDTPVDSPSVPLALVRAALPDSTAGVSFVSPALGAAATHSPLPPLRVLQDEAVQASPVLREHEAMISADNARLDVVRKERIPDADVSLEYDQRSGFRDFVTAMVSLPIPMHGRRKQGQMVIEARSQLAADEAQHGVAVNDIRAAVASEYAEVERARTQLALYAKAILPQANASLRSVTVSYEAGRRDFASVLLAQATVFDYETDYHRALTDFAKGLAKLERTVGRGLVP
jgi:cobalt-zinc-cadmium efflux system outer membrane protein